MESSKILKLIFFFALVGVSTFTTAKTNLGVLLQDRDDNILTQVSGLTHFKDTFYFVSQEEHKLYFAHQSELLEKKPDIIKLKFIELNGDIPEDASWEAAAFAQNESGIEIYMTYEHTGEDGVGNFHGVYKGKFSENTNQPITLTPISTELPLNSAIPAPENHNFGYEALTALNNGQLLLISEMDGQNALNITELGEIKDVVISNHGLRVSDMTKTSNPSCFITTSFCYKHDPVCQKNNDKTSLKLAAFFYNQQNQQLTLNSLVDLSQQYLSIPISDGETLDLYNAEGITLVDNDVFVVNDNRPSNGVGTYFQHWRDITVDQKHCKVLYK